MKSMLFIALALTSLPAFAHSDKLLCSGTGKFAVIGQKVVSTSELDAESPEVAGVKGKILATSPFIKVEGGAKGRMLISISADKSIHLAEGSLENIVSLSEVRGGEVSTVQCLPIQ